MQKKQFPIMPKGMQKDLAVNVFPNEMAFDIKNMRLTVSKDNNLLGLVNESGNSKVEWELLNLGNKVSITDTTSLGLCIIEKYIIIFAKATINEEKNLDIILRVKIESSNKLSYIFLYKGKELNFNTNNPIECECVYENEFIQKVYWVDGINQLRVININPKEHKGNGALNSPYYDINMFDIIPDVSVPKVDVDTLLYGGEFPAGIIQHAISYYRKNSQESSLVWISPIRYLGTEHGLSPDSKSTDSFLIKVESNIDTSFDYLRLYSIVRTSLNDTPIVKVVKDVNIKNLQNAKKETPLIIEDNGTEGYPISSTYLLFLNNNIIYPSTITSKDNTLFLGNIKNESTEIDISDLEALNEVEVKTYYKTVENKDINNLNYEGFLNHSAKKISAFKWDEDYRLGIQGKNSKGILSEVVYIGDYRQDKHPYTQGNIVYLPTFMVKVNPSLRERFKDAGFTDLRLVMAERNTVNKRRILGQGILCPTVFRMEDRMTNSPFAQSSWIMRGAGHHGELLSLNNTSEGEIQSQSPIVGNSSIYTGINEVDGKTGELTSEGKIRADKLRNLYYIDDSIVTFHSPELDSFMYSIDESVKLRIIGVLGEFINTSNYYIKASSLGENQESVVKRNLPSIKSNLLYGNNLSGYATYMWHRKGSLDNSEKPVDNTPRKSELQKKIILNSRLAKGICYYSIEEGVDSLWNDSPKNIKVFNQDYISASLLENDSEIDFQEGYYYYGNIDSVLTFKNEERYKVYSGAYNSKKEIQIYLDSKDFTTDPIPIKYKSTPHAVIQLGNMHKGNSIVQQTLPYYKELDIPKTAVGTLWNSFATYKYYINKKLEQGPLETASEKNVGEVVLLKEPQGYYRFYKSEAIQNIDLSITYEWTLLSITPKRIQIEGNDSVYDVVYDTSNIYNIIDIIPFSKNVYSLYGRKVLNTLNCNSKEIIYLAELYKDIEPYLDKSKESLKNETWIPISSFDSLISGIFKATRGDTYYQRWDCLKTYPFTKEDINQVIDITSFMVESHINLDGRYDKRRYTDLTIDNTNFNKINPVYSQSDNYFNYHIIDSDTSIFPNQIVWSMTKTLGEKIDSWTNILASNVLDLDGDKGTVNSLNRFTNEIYAFQDKGIARIIFNPRAAVSTSDGIPIELANSYKVDGKVYMTDKYGCTNKWSIAESPLGLYFIDSNIKTICLFNGQNIEDIATSKGMYSWAKENIDSTIWSPKLFNADSYNSKAIRVHYDSTTNDLYITNNKTALAYNEKLGQFSSFYSYERVPWLFNIEGESYQFRDNNIWKIHGNTEKCNFFNSYKGYSLRVVANPEFQVDKIFENIEFRCNDTIPVNYGKAEDYPFSFIGIKNEYQASTSNSLSLKKKFRTWRWQIPRDKRNRIRNPWTYISMKGESRKDVIVYDIAITYYV